MVGLGKSGIASLGQVRGMKVRSSVKRFCDGCSVVRRWGSPLTRLEVRADCQEGNGVYRLQQGPKAQAGRFTNNVPHFLTWNPLMSCRDRDEYGSLHHV
jgi:hypothetical protein